MAEIFQTIDFNSTLDVAAAARVFAARRRVRIADVLEAAAAERLYYCLGREVPWRLTYNEQAKNIFLDEQELESLGTQGQRDVLQQVLTRAAEEFQYLYRSFPMVTAYLRKEHPELLLHDVFEWLNDPRTLEVFRTITGIESIAKADAQATYYRPGHFLTQHDDSGKPKELRRVAYVLNMTRGWRADWGGQLQFLDEANEVEEVWMPRFNALALFLVPTPHVVTYVPPFAREPRYAITGWLCDA
jgi:Rps23 Pro-64 3,4-dihydroxylase Tpa1-like proline 4-hydroxylase